jgi:hypothetical protein
LGQCEERAGEFANVDLLAVDRFDPNLSFDSWASAAMFSVHLSSFQSGTSPLPTVAPSTNQPARHYARPGKDGNYHKPDPDPRQQIEGDRQKDGACEN